MRARVCTPVCLGTCVPTDPPRGSPPGRVGRPAEKVADQQAWAGERPPGLARRRGLARTPEHHPRGPREEGRVRTLARSLALSGLCKQEQRASAGWRGVRVCVLLVCFKKTATYCGCRREGPWEGRVTWGTHEGAGSRRPATAGRGVRRVCSDKEGRKDIRRRALTGRRGGPVCSRHGTAATPGVLASLGP